MKKIMKNIFIGFVLIINTVSCVDMERSVLFAGNSKNSDYNFSELKIPKDSWELVKMNYGNCDNYGLYVKGKNDVYKDKIVLFFHGNGGRIDKGTQIEMANFFYENGINFFAMEYRGYGQSSGFTTTEASTYEDAQYAYNYLLTIDSGKFKDGNIIIMGHSLGSAVAIDLATKENEKSLITMSAFTDFTNELKGFTSFDIPGSWISDAKYDNINKIDKINSNVLFIHGSNDKMVSPSNSKDLFNKARGTKKLMIVEGAGHDDIGEKLDDKTKAEIIKMVSDN
ncbi:alpha/beta hydrolase [Haliovirga abyssi]|uniref:Serine aminopeptidase S33 domain-containing protein n=1 Tax=Haliovirga abyssi TaxID=2996794 RepID=A0AAU9DN16_9FUSO|nr:alpha/beta hydrolase [Haliovirga abyssi]BDU51447.1 hypothetical protein HLVA_20160 [Haliovirga abyssi]